MASGWSSAAFMACQERVAHFTLIGNSDTPEKTASLPELGCFPFVPDASNHTTETVEEQFGFLLASFP